MSRTLGHTGIEVSDIGFGCWAIGGPFTLDGRADGYGATDDRESVAAVRRGLELGVTFFDTADVYGTGHSERILGEALRTRRDEVVIATKFGYTFDAARRAAAGQDVTPAYIRRACEDSLRRLGTDRIDLYQLHVGDLPAAAAAATRAAAIQHDLNVLSDAPAMLAVCEASGLASVNRTPLGMGLLTGKFTRGDRLPDSDVRAAQPWVRYFAGGRPAPGWLTKLDAIRDVLTGGGRTLAQVPGPAVASSSRDATIRSG